MLLYDFLLLPASSSIIYSAKTASCKPNYEYQYWWLVRFQPMKLSCLYNRIIFQSATHGYSVLVMNAVFIDIVSTLERSQSQKSTTLPPYLGVYHYLQLFETLHVPCEQHFGPVQPWPPHFKYIVRIQFERFTEAEKRRVQHTWPYMLAQPF